MSKKPQKKPVLAVIAGGGCRQLEAATGMLQAIEEKGVVIDRYFGCSAGSAIAALHASGVSGRRLEELIRATPVKKLFRPCLWCQLGSWLGLHADHLFDNSGLYQMLEERMTPEAGARVRVAVSKRDTLEAMMCDATPKTVAASAAIPEVFPPVKIGGEYYVDGGVRNLIPMPRLREVENYEHIYVLLCNDDAPGKPPKTRIGRAINAAFQTMEREKQQIHESGWDELESVTVIEPSPFASGLLAWSKDFGLIAHAREAARKKLSEKTK